MAQYKRVAVVISLPTPVDPATTTSEEMLFALVDTSTVITGYAYDGRVYRDDNDEPIPALGEVPNAALVICGDPDTAVDLASRGYRVAPPIDAACVFCGTKLYEHRSYHPAICWACRERLPLQAERT
jgi:hypothetical protein